MNLSILKSRARAARALLRGDAMIYNVTIYGGHVSLGGGDLYIGGTADIQHCVIETPNPVIIRRYGKQTKVSGNTGNAIVNPEIQDA